MTDHALRLLVDVHLTFCDLYMTLRHIFARLQSSPDNHISFSGCSTVGTDFDAREDILTRTTIRSTVSSTEHVLRRTVMDKHSSERLRSCSTHMIYFTKSVIPSKYLDCMLHQSQVSSMTCLPDKLVIHTRTCCVTLSRCLKQLLQW